MTMNKLGIHKRWNHKFLLKEIACRIPEHAGLTPEQLAQSLAGHAKDCEEINAYASGDPEFDLRDALLPLRWHGQFLMRKAQYTIYKHGNLDRAEVSVAAWHRVLSMLLGFGWGTAQRRPAWSPKLRDVAQTIAVAYAVGWNATAGQIAESAANFMPERTLWTEEDEDPRWQRNREPFARFTWALWADFAGVSLPKMPDHPYESPAYDRLLACWKSPDPQALIEPLLDVCDWHTHECMYSRSMLPSKQVDFIDDTLMGWAIEVHMVYRLRERLGLALPPELDHPLMKAPLGAYLPPQPIPRDERLERVIRRAYSEVPGLEEVLQQAMG